MKIYFVIYIVIFLAFLYSQIAAGKWMACKKEEIEEARMRNWQATILKYDIYLNYACISFLKFFKNNIKKIWLREIAGRKCKCSWQFFPNIWKYMQIRKFMSFKVFCVGLLILLDELNWKTEFVYCLACFCSIDANMTCGSSLEIICNFEQILEIC